MANFAFGLGVGTKSAKGEWLEVYYNLPLHNADDALVNAVAAKIGYQGGNAAIEISAAQLNSLEAAFLS
ncbi:MAG: 2,3,4,5-tetrahydropyridine-2,6-dicarboxylate N-succinyltransferase, partial [Oceanisphaera sp.]|nr:2,3,4,5-tetrahydropyridine-2,6-dicarboxylate N-succinyltransferase [Oceanisphaera sp.]